MKISCHECGLIIEREDGKRIGRSDECERCHFDLHSCLMCIFYSPGAYNDCSEPVAERVSEKSRSNFCDYFEITSDQHKKKDTRSEERSKAEALFGKKS